MIRCCMSLGLVTCSFAVLGGRSPATAGSRYQEEHGTT